MDKKVVVLIHPGLPYTKTIRYASERAKEMSAKVTLLGIIPEFDGFERAALSIHEFGPYDTVTNRMEADIAGFLERAVQFCLDSGITVDFMLEKGKIEEVIKRIVKDVYIRLVIVPTPTKKPHHAAFLDAISQFTHNMLEHDLRCPVVSVLAT